LHAAEDLLAAIHGRQLSVTSAMIDQALACLDQVSRWVDAFEASGTVPFEAGEQAQAMALGLRKFLAENAAPQRARSDPGVSENAGDRALPEWVSRLIMAERTRIIGHLQERPSALVAVSYEPRPGCFFDGADPLSLMRAVPNLLVFHLRAREAWPPLADLDPYACNLRLEAVSGSTRAELADIFRLVSDQARIVDIPLEALPPERDATSGNRAQTELVRAIIEEQRRVLAASTQRDDLTGRLGAAARVAANAVRHCGRADLTPPIEHARDAAFLRADAMPLLSALGQVLASLAPEAQAGPGGDGAVQRTADFATDEPGPAAIRSLRVDERRVDALFNMAGELIVAKNGFAHLAKRIADEIGDHELAAAVKRQHETIERLVGEMHVAILQLRMVPVAQVFRSFPRLVRDMAQRLNKKVALVTRGETTEADKTVVDRLFEPLLHLVRNALDHGIEGPEPRRSAGKAAAATVTLQALRVGDRFIVEVSDDGRGIDPELVRRKSLEQGIIAADELAALADDQILDLVFAPGFSTAAEVSDISGRGVGMDVVRSAIEQIGGKVSLTSSVGAGTTVRLDLPMNIAMTRIMVVEAAGQVFGIPMDGVTETLRLTPDRISRIKGNDAFVLRDRVVPICPLAELMKLPTPPGSGSAIRLLVVIEAGGKNVAIEVDAVRDRLEIVLKPLQGLLANARGYAGTTLLGDGKVLLVLDLKEILP
ncbi:MAG: two-component system, chemotaxis family, sensor kinase CheA, partial [Alphaproteobacteria bacterium]|nr:two-component system, chemotaxis family, sensor kinase CheA [Alphaproteobacteria bacterium]